jgi:endonuclease YncB( thermonuclease family)
MRKLYAIAAAFAIAFLAFLYTRVGPDERGIEATVSRVIDGDTIELANGDVVRLIGIDAPEKNQPYSEDIVAELKKLEGKSVRMEKDTTNKDRYGRYLRYVYLGEHFVNLELVQSGLAYAYTVNPDKRHEDSFKDAERHAMENELGIWKKSEYSDCIVIDKFHYNAKGDDSKNLADEYLSIKNVCSSGLDLSGWKFRNKYDYFDIPAFEVAAGSAMKIVTGNGTSSPGSVFLFQSMPIWSNKEDSMYLIDDQGRVVLEKSYKN